jgi:geranylgeranyl pyrophosphate synthase
MMTSTQPLWLEADLEAVEQQVLSIQQEINSILGFSFGRYVPSPLARCILSAAHVHSAGPNQRQYLAAACELLLLANRIHSQLRLDNSTESNPVAQVLAGDALLAQSALLAAAVENLEVMRSFSTMVSILSEENLRLLLESESARSSTTMWMRVYAEGLEATGQLCNLGVNEIAALRSFGKHLGYIAALRTGASVSPIESLSQQVTDALDDLSPFPEGEAKQQLEALIMNLITQGMGNPKSSTR